MALGDNKSTAFVFRQRSVGNRVLYVDHRPSVYRAFKRRSRIGPLEAGLVCGWRGNRRDGIQRFADRFVFSDRISKL